MPEPQQRALDAALLRSDVTVPDQRAVSLAALGVVRAIAARGPVVIAIDDIQWLDAPSSRAMAFLLRRLQDEPVHVVASQRLGADTPSARVEIAQALGDAACTG